MRWRCWWSWDAGAAGLSCGEAALGAGPLRSASPAAATTRASRGCWGPWVPVTPPCHLLGPELAAFLPRQLPCSPRGALGLGQGLVKEWETSSTSGPAAGKARLSRQRCKVWFGEHPQAAVCLPGAATWTLPLVPQIPKPTAPRQRRDL